MKTTSVLSDIADDSNIKVLKCFTNINFPEEVKLHVRLSCYLSISVWMSSYYPDCCTCVFIPDIAPSQMPTS